MTAVPAIGEAARDRAVRALAASRRTLDARASAARAAVPGALLLLAGVASTPWVGSRGLAVGALAGWLVVALSAPVGLVAFAWAALLPVEVLRGVSPVALDLARYLGVAVLVLRVPATASVRSASWRTWALLLVGLGVARLAAAGILRDGTSLEVGAVVVVGAVGALLVAVRPAILRQVLLGFLAGASLSATVVVFQVLGFRTIGGPLTNNLRYPGLSPLTSALTWPLALAVVVAVCGLLDRPAGLVSRRAGWAALVVCSVALVACGAQGGFVGLFVAALFIGRDLWKAVGRTSRWALVAVLVGGLAVVATVILALDVDGFIPDKGFVNEISRGESWVDGLRVFRDHPWVGVTDAEYRADHEVRPHTVVVEAAVAAGVVGAALGIALVWQLLRVALAGRGRQDSRVLGAGLAAVLFAATFLEGSTFTGLNRATYVVLAVAAVEHRSSLRDRSAPRAGSSGEPSRSSP